MKFYLAILSLEYADLCWAWLHVFTLIEGDSTWDVNVEEVSFSVFSHDVPLSVKA